MKKALLSLLAIFAMLLWLSACSDDSTSPEDIPDTGSVSGTVTFTGTWPSNGDIQVSIYTGLNPPYIPMGPPEQATDPIPANTGTYSFKFEGLEKTTYSAVFVGWRDPSDPTASRLLGMYWTDPNATGIDPMTGLPQAAPTTITIDNDHIDITGINLTGDLDLAP